MKFILAKNKKKKKAVNVILATWKLFLALKTENDFFTHGTLLIRSEKRILAFKAPLFTQKEKHWKFFPPQRTLILAMEIYMNAN